MASYALGIDVLVKGLGGLNQVNSALNKIDKNGATVASTFRLARGAFIALGGAAVIKSLLDVAGAAEKTTRELTALYGGAQLGKQAFDTAQKFARDYNLSLQEVQKASVVLARISPLPQDLQKNLEQAGVASAAFGVSVDKAAEMIAKANVEGIGTTSELAQYIKRFYPEIAKEAEKSGLRASEALAKLLGKNGPLGSALKDQAESVTGSLTQVQNALIGFGTSYLDGLVSSFQGGKIELEGFNKAFTILGVVIGEVFAAFINVGRLIVNFFSDIGKSIGGFYEVITGGFPTIERFKEAFEKINLNQTTALFNEINKGKDIVTRLREAWNGTKVATQDADKAAQALSRSYQAQADQDNIPAYIINQELRLQKDLYYQLTRAGQDAFAQLIEASNPYQESVNLLKNAFGSLKTQAAEALYDILTGAKSASEALGGLARAIFKQLITGFIALAIEIFVLEKVREKFRAIRDEVYNVNQQLKKQIALQAALAVFSGGFGIPFFAQGGAVSANAPIIVGEKGPELFVPNSNGRIIPNNQMDGADTASVSGDSKNVTVNFNINTVDASDFDDLLIQRQALIISIINKALNERGQRSLA